MFDRLTMQAAMHGNLEAQKRLFASSRPTSPEGVVTFSNLGRDVQNASSKASSGEAVEEVDVLK